MKIFELESDARLTRSLIAEVGEEYTLKERIAERIFGLGQLIHVPSGSVLDAFYDSHQRAIKTHIDWTRSGAVIRLRTMSAVFAIGLAQEGFGGVTLTKRPDEMEPMPFGPFWILLRLGVRFGIARWFAFGRLDQFSEGDCEIAIEHCDNLLKFSLHGDMWSDCLSTFRTAHVRNILTVDDQRTWVTRNGLRINPGKRWYA